VILPGETSSSQALRLWILHWKIALGLLDCANHGTIPRRAWLVAYFVKFEAARIVAANRIAYFRCSSN
jgi:hypothetical protein